MGIAFIPEQQDVMKSDLEERSFHAAGERKLLGQWAPQSTSIIF